MIEFSAAIVSQPMVMIMDKQREKNEPAPASAEQNRAELSDFGHELAALGAVLKALESEVCGTDSGGKRDHCFLVSGNRSINRDTLNHHSKLPLAV